MKRYPPLERAITYIEAHLNEYIGLNEVSQEKPATPTTT